MSSAPDSKFKRTDTCIPSREQGGLSKSPEMHAVNVERDNLPTFDQSMMTQSSNSIDSESTGSNRPYPINFLETSGTTTTIVKNRSNRPIRPGKKSKLKDSGSDGASTLSCRDITQYFGQIEYCGYKTITECIPGDTPEEVLQGLIDNMKETGITLSISTAEELLSTLKNVPEETKEKINKVEKHFLAILQKIGSTSSRQDFFEKLQNSVLTTRQEPQFCPVPSCSTYLEELCVFTLDELYPVTVTLSKEGNTEMHAKWRNVLQSFLHDFCLGCIPQSTNDDWALITFSMLHNGDKTYKMSIIPEPTPLEKNPADSTTDDTNRKPTLLIKPAKEFRATPDVTIKARIRYLDGERVEVAVLNCETKTSNLATLRAFIYTAADSMDVAGTASTSTAVPSPKANVSTTHETTTKQTHTTTLKSSIAQSKSGREFVHPSNTMNTASKRQASDSVSSAESSKRQRVDSDKDSDFGTCGTKLLSQHFMELLGAIRASGECVNFYKTFGIYQIMNRIFFTHLSPATNGDPNSRAQLYKCRNFPKMKCSSDYHEANIAEPSMWFRMSICRYLDLFKANHFGAFTAMVQYIVYHNVQEVARKNKI